MTSETVPPAEEVVRPGDVIGGKYRLLYPLTEGGMGALWIAHNTALDIDVAVKVIRTDLVALRSRTAVKRLLQEARAAAKLGHPAIVRITDFGETDAGHPYLVMELLEGENLADSLQRRGRMSAINAVRLVLPIAHALSLAHDKGIVHRDVKPENIFLARTDERGIQPKLIDFGVAKVVAAEPDQRLTDMGVVLGSPVYMAPEAARGDEVDAMADVWSLCVVLYELCTGALPFQAPNFHALLRVIIESAPTPMTAQSAGDAALWAILERGLAKHPAARWPSMRALGVALAEWLLERDIAEDVCGASLEAVWLRQALSSSAEHRARSGRPSDRGPDGEQRSVPPLVTSSPPRSSPSSIPSRQSEPAVERSSERVRRRTPAQGSVSRRRVGRCELFGEIACGGMATIHVGRMLGAGSFAKTVAIKRLHPQYAKDAAFATMLHDEARVLARIQHPNVVPTLDVIDDDGELLVVMELVEGITLDDLLDAARARGERPPVGVVLRALIGVLNGLQAAHEARDEDGQPLGIVHRDVSPDNVLVGADGFARVLDFGVARALGQTHKTGDGIVKGKVAYMAPEQLVDRPVTQATDVFAASVVLWEALTGEGLFRRDGVGETMHRTLNHAVEPPSAVATGIPVAVDSVVLRGLERDPARRWQSARAMAVALDSLGLAAREDEVGAWTLRLGGPKLERLRALVGQVERTPRTRDPRPTPVEPAAATVVVTPSGGKKLWWIGAVAAAAAALAVMALVAGRGDPPPTPGPAAVVPAIAAPPLETVAPPAPTATATAAPTQSASGAPRPTASAATPPPKLATPPPRPRRPIYGLE
jgi:serine/threonine-protein kinase